MLIAAAARTPFTPVHGRLSGWHPVALGAHVLHAIAAETGISPAAVDFVIAGCAMPVGAQGDNLARAAALAAGWPPNIGAFTVDSNEASSHQALHLGVAMIAAGQAHAVIVLGVEVSSLVPAGASALNRNYGAPWGPALERFAAAGGLVPEGVALDRLAAERGFSAEQLVAHADAARARAQAFRSDHLVATDTMFDGKAPTKAIGRCAADEVVQPPADAPPLFDDAGTTSAATMAPAADGAAALLLVSDDVADQLPESPLARVGATATTGAEPPAMFAAVPALVQGLNAHQPADVVIVDSAGAAVELLVDPGPSVLNPGGGNLGRGRPTGAAGLAAVIEAIDHVGPHGGAAVVVSSASDGQAVGTRIAVLPRAE